MASEYYLNGVPLDDPAGRWFVTSETLLPTLGSPRNISTVVPLRSGVMPLAPVAVEPFQVTVKMVVQDSGQGRGGLDRNWWALIRSVRQLGRLLKMQHRPPGGTAKEALVRLSSSVEPSFHYFENMIETTLVFEGVEGFWRDEYESEADLKNLGLMAGSALPINDAVIDIETPSRIMKITDVASGLSLSWTGVIPPDTYHMVINCYDYTVHLGSTWWAATGPDVGADLSVPPGGWSFTPDALGNFRVRTEGVNANARVKFRRHY